MSISETLENIMRAGVEDIRTQMERMKENASGRTAASFSVRKVSDYHFQIVQQGEHVAPWRTLEIGREGGKIPAGFGDILAEWSRNKGMPFASDRDRLSFGWALATRIAREGTLRHAYPITIFKQVFVNTQNRISREVQPHFKAFIANSISKQLKGK